MAQSLAESISIDEPVLFAMALRADDRVLPRGAKLARRRPYVSR